MRATSMLRTTIHLMTADDWLALRPVLQVVSDRGFATGSPFGRQLAGMDIEEVLDAGREALAERPRTASQLRSILGERWPDRDAASLAYAVRYLLPLVQTTPRAVWGKRGQPVLATARMWLGREVGTDTDPTDLILRYLRAFGPASVMDVQAWSWLTKLTPYVEALRPQLRTFRDENGKELFDVPDGLLPDPDTPAPPRFLPTYDNVVLGHKDRSRIIGPAGVLARRQGPVGRGLPARVDPGRRVRRVRLADGPRRQGRGRDAGRDARSEGAAEPGRAGRHRVRGARPAADGCTRGRPRRAVRHPDGQPGLSQGRRRGAMAFRP